MFCFQKVLWSFTVWINCSSDLNYFANSWPSTPNFKGCSQSLEQFQKQNIIFHFFYTWYQCRFKIIKIYVNGSLKKPCDYAYSNTIKKRKYLCQGVFICGPTCTTKCHFFISFLESATKCAFRHSTIIRSKSCKVYKFWEGHKILRNFHLTFD